VRLRRTDERATFALGEKPAVIGAGQAADIGIVGAGIAESHAKISSSRLEAFYKCVVGGVPLGPGRTRLVFAGTPLSIGSASFLVEDDEEDPPASSVETRELAFKVIARGTLPPSAPTVVVAEGADAGKRLVLRDEGPRSVGRSDACDLPLSDPSLSRSHFEVELSGDHVLVCDRGATGGTFLGEARLAPAARATWPPGVMLRAGRVVFALLMPRDLWAVPSPGGTPNEAPPPASLTDSLSSMRSAGGATAGIADVGAGAGVASTSAAPLPTGWRPERLLLTASMALLIGGAVAALAYLLLT